VHLTRRDAVATLLVAAIAVPYVGYLVRGSMPFIEDPRGMAGAALIIGLLAFGVVGQTAVGEGLVKFNWNLLSIVTFGLGVAALFAETNELLLATFIGSIIGLWAFAMLVHAGAFAQGVSSLTWRESGRADFAPGR
jgi:hypothetical protein